MKLHEAIATKKKIKRYNDVTFQEPKYINFRLDDIEADDWEVESENDLKLYHHHFYPDYKCMLPSYYTRSTKELAEESRKNMIRMLRLDALMRQLEPDWVTDWNDLDASKCYVVYDHESKVFIHRPIGSSEIIGSPCCRLATAIKICELLNYGQFSLDEE